MKHIKVATAVIIGFCILSYAQNGLGQRQSFFDRVLGRTGTEKVAQSISDARLSPEAFVTRIYDPTVNGRVDKKDFIAYKNSEELFKEVKANDHIVILSDLVLEKNRGYYLKDNVLSGMGEATTITIPEGTTLTIENSRVNDLVWKGGKRGLIIANSRLKNIKYIGNQSGTFEGLLRRLPATIPNAYAEEKVTACNILEEGDIKTSIKGVGCDVGVFVTGDSECDKCEFYNNDVGVIVGYGDEKKGTFTLKNSEVHDNKQGENKVGIYVAENSSLVLYNTNVLNNGIGIYALRSNGGVTITDSTIANNSAAGIMADGNGDFLSSPLPLTINNSKLLSNGIPSSEAKDSMTASIWLKGNVKLSIEDSHIDNNQIGIGYSGENYVYAYKNKFTANAFGIYFAEIGSLTGISVYKENIFNGNGIGILLSFEGSPAYNALFDLGTADDPGGNYFIEANRCNISNNSRGIIPAMGNWWDWYQKEKPSFGDEMEELKMPEFELIVCKKGGTDIVDYPSIKNIDDYPDEIFSLTKVMEPLVPSEISKNWVNIKKYHLGKIQKVFQGVQE